MRSDLIVCKSVCDSHSADRDMQDSRGLTFRNAEKPLSFKIGRPPSPKTETISALRMIDLTEYDTFLAFLQIETAQPSEYSSTIVSG